MSRARELAPYLLVSLTMAAPEALAYLDPSTGGMILSAIVGMFATAALAIKTYWYKLRRLLRRHDPERHESPDDVGGPRPGSTPTAD
jgi:multisubunit Na+/H+ antiporter MnhC subunit